MRMRFPFFTAYEREISRMTSRDASGWTRMIFPLTAINTLRPDRSADLYATFVARAARSGMLRSGLSIDRCFLAIKLSCSNLASLSPLPFFTPHVEHFLARARGRGISKPASTRGGSITERLHQAVGGAAKTLSLKPIQACSNAGFQWLPCVRPHISRWSVRT